MNAHILNLGSTLFKVDALDSGDVTDRTTYAQTRAFALRRFTRRSDQPRPLTDIMRRRRLDQVRASLVLTIRRKDSPVDIVAERLMKNLGMIGIVTWFPACPEKFRRKFRFVYPSNRQV
ncbi:MAG: hypothetical protein Q4G03_05560 [Planctomycetia bacterium]|nr:hypothetical protein [Planctomycetia bacterium]